VNKPFPHLEPAMESGALDQASSLFVTTQDGLRLHVWEYCTRAAPGVPIVCLPGLARTVADFDVLAPVLAKGPPQRRVICIDSCGRGRSEYDRNHLNYSLVVETTDIISVLTALAVSPAVFVGSSRGGMLAMQLGAAHPTAVAGIVLHDVGPVIEARGFARIKSYVGKLPQPRSFEEGAYMLRRLMDTQFPKLTDEQWLGAARRTWQMTDGVCRETYDARLALTLAGFDIERPIPPMWNAFDSLAHVPVMVIRGANSDILSVETVAAMKLRRPDMEAIEVPDQGHVPLLQGELLQQIARFVERCESAASAKLTASSTYQPAL